MPRREEIEQLYDRTYFNGPAARYSYQAQVKEQLACYRNHAAKFKVMAANYNILDVGCATGEFMQVARQTGLNMTGVDLSAYACDVARSRGLRVIHGDLYDRGLQQSYFGAIHLSHILEHLDQPGAALKRLHHLLAPGGIIYVEVPYQFDSWLERINAHRRELPSFAPWRLHHRSFFSPQSLEQILIRHGFQTLQQTTFLPCRRALRSPGPRKWTLQVLLWLADKLAHKGDVIAVWARKTSD